MCRRSGRLGRQRHAVEQAGVPEQRPIARGVGAAAFGPAVEMRRLDAEDRGLQRVHAEIAADQVVVVLRLHPVRPQQPRALRQRHRHCVVSRPASPNAPRFLLGKNEKQPNAPRPPSGRDLYVAPMACAASSTIGIPARDAPSSIGSMSALRPNRCTGTIAFVRGVMAGDGLRRVDVEGRRIDVDEHRPRAQAGDRAGRREKRVGRRDDLVARPMSSAMSASSSASVPEETAMAWRTPSIARQLALERGDLGAHDEALAVADACDRGENLVAKRPVLRLRDRAAVLSVTSAAY